MVETTRPRTEPETNGKNPRTGGDDPADPVALLEEWLTGIRIAHVGHRRAATVFGRRARILGVVTTLASAFVGTTVFTSISNSADPNLLVIAAVVSVIAVITSALQTFLNYGELVAAHRRAATGYATLRRRVEHLLVFVARDSLQESMATIATDWNKLDEDSPDLPSGIFQYAQRWVGHRGARGRGGQAASAAT